MSNVIVTPINSPYTVDLTGSENLQASNVTIQTSGGNVSIVLPAVPAVGAPIVTVVALSNQASVSLASGVLGVVNSKLGLSGYASGVVGTANAGSYFKATSAGGYWVF